MINADDEFVPLLTHLLSVQSARSAPGECLTEEDLGIYLGGSLAENERQKVEGHLVRCSHCLEVTIAANLAAQRIDVQPPPNRALKRAMALVLPTHIKPPTLQLVVRLLEDSLELLSTSGESLLTPAGPMVRGMDKSLSGTIIQVSKQLERVLVTVEVEQTEKEGCQVAVKISSGDAGLADGLRISLCSGDREQASYLAHGGSAIFEDVLAGKYELTLTKLGTYVGSVQLEICR